MADNQPYSFDELESRKLRVHRALEGMGFRSVATSVNITGAGIIPAGVTTEPGLPTRAVDLVAALPADLREDVRLTVHEEPNVREEQAFGGMWVRDSGVNLCTSGWSVVNTSGTRWCARMADLLTTATAPSKFKTPRTHARTPA